MLGLNEFTKAFMKANAATAQEQVNMLSDIFEQWETTGEEPCVVAALSSGERSALFFSVRQEERIESPLSAFFMLEDSLQRWVLEKRGMERFIGLPLGRTGL